MTNGMSNCEEKTMQLFRGMSFRKAFEGSTASTKIGKPHDLFLWAGLLIVVMNVKRYPLRVLKVARKEGEEGGLNEVNGEVAGLEGRRNVVAGDPQHVIIETSQKVVECCNFA